MIFSRIVLSAVSHTRNFTASQGFIFTVGVAQKRPGFVADGDAYDKRLGQRLEVEKSLFSLVFACFKVWDVSQTAAEDHLCEQGAAARAEEEVAGQEQGLGHHQRGGPGSYAPCRGSEKL